uniref:RWD domain-containing protein n=1 Tax=Ditylenchus dipsaci TaxID=166011 RepID=A0A915E5E9_9BILA
MLTPLSDERYQRQKDELQALESIFGEDIVSAKIQNCWKQPCPLEITIRLKPPFVDEVFVSLELEVTCSSNYPEHSPTFRFHNPVELSQKDLEELRQLLVTKSEENSGMEVIYELCQTTQEFLAGMNRKPVSSMHEMMLKEKAMKEIEQEVGHFKKM